jgi:hypothetical protein
MTRPQVRAVGTECVVALAFVHDGLAEGTAGTLVVWAEPHRPRDPIRCTRLAPRGDEPPRPVPPWARPVVTILHAVALAYSRCSTSRADGAIRLEVKPPLAAQREQVAEWEVALEEDAVETRERPGRRSGVLGNELPHGSPLPSKATCGG